MQYFEYLENNYPSLRQTGLLAFSIISKYGFDSDEGIDATEMYRQSFETFYALHNIDRK